MKWLQQRCLQTPARKITVKTERDEYKRGFIYDVDLPNQHGIEQFGVHPCLVVSNDDFNDEARGFIMVPMTTARKNGKEKFERPRATWIRVITSGEPGFVLCEQIRFVDKDRVKHCYDQMSDYDLLKVDAMLKRLLSEGLSSV